MKAYWQRDTVLSNLRHDQEALFHAESGLNMLSFDTKKDCQDEVKIILAALRQIKVSIDKRISDEMQPYNGRTHDDDLRRVADETKNRPGYVYVAYAGSSLYKIGYTKKTPKQRVERLVNDYPGYSFTLILSIATNDAWGFESELHSRFESRHALRELYRLTEDDLDWLRETYDVE